MPALTRRRSSDGVASVRHDDVLRAASGRMKLAHGLARTMPMGVRSQDTWYVSFEPKKSPTGKRAFSRTTETFRSELEAKEFAKQKLTETQNVSAGTLNPHLPKRVISSASIIQWLGKPSDTDAATTAASKPQKICG